MNEDRIFQRMSIVIFAIAIVFVLLAHKWSIEGLHKRVTQLESQVSRLDLIEKVAQ